MSVEPLPNIRDGMLVERLVKTMRHIADMRRCQDVIQRPEGVRRRQRLNVKYVDRRAADLLVLQHTDQGLLLDDRSARCINQQGRGLHSLQLRGAYQAARTAAQHQMDRQDVGPLEQLALLPRRETSSGSGQTHRKALSSASTQRERGNPCGERSGTGYCQKLNARLRRHERRLHVSHGLLAIVLPASESALNAISRMSMATRTGFRIFCLLPSGA